MFGLGCFEMSYYIKISKLFAVGALSLASLNSYAASIKVYAAASLTNALTDIAKQYEQQSGNTVTPVFAASSTLAKQIEAGAPADVFFAADEKWMSYLIQKGRVDAGQVSQLLNNDLVMIAPKGNAFRFKASPDFKIAQAFKGYLCTGQTESVPVGIYAKQSLSSLGWLDQLKGRVVGTDDVRAALTFVERGECSAGIVYSTDAKISNKVQVVGVFPENTHKPIVYPVAVTKSSAEAAITSDFVNYLKNNPQAQAIFTKYGFSLIKSVR
jgi:molybdate transport system substrate-binding protein